MQRQILVCAGMLLGVATTAMATESGDDLLTNSTALRVATFNVEDIRTTDLLADDQPRLTDVAKTLADIGANIVLINEIAHDEPGAAGFDETAGPGRNGQRLIDHWVQPAMVARGSGIRYRAFMAPSNTGRPSGFDLDRNGEVVRTFPTPPPTRDDGSPGPQTDGGRAFGGDCWGFGTFPGQYAMALLVDDRLEILTDRVRTFRYFPWSAMPGNLMPTTNTDEDGDGELDPWYAGEAGHKFRLSSKSHWDVPVRLPDGSVLHVLASHPTPPSFDGDEDRNGRRNHDEIRFWADYIAGAAYIIDDAGERGGLEPGARFVILGDLNADPTAGSSTGDPIGTYLLDNPRLNAGCTPESEIEVDGLDATDTAHFRLRVDYVLPSAGIAVDRCGIWRRVPAGADSFPSDHFPVWADLVVPAGGE